MAEGFLNLFNFAPGHIMASFANWTGLVFTAFLVLLSFRIYAQKPATPAHPALLNERMINLLLVVLGLLVGSGLAVLWIPLNEEETELFEKIGSAVAVFASGYLVSKTDKILDQTVFNAQADALTRIRTVMFLCAVLIAALVIGTNRVDYRYDQKLKKEAKALEAAKAAKLPAALPAAPAPGR